MSVDLGSAQELVRTYLTGATSATDALADDVVLQHPWGEFRGPEAVTAVDDELVAAFPDREVEVTDLFTRGDRALARSVWRGTQTGPYRGAAPTGRTAEIVTFYDVRVRGGRIESIVAITDSLHVFKQLGLFPPATTLPAPLAYAALWRQKLLRDRGGSPEWPAPTDERADDDPGSPADVARRFLEAAYARDDTEAAAPLVADDAIIHYHTSEAPMRGRAEVIAVAENLRGGFPDMTTGSRLVLGDAERALSVSDWFGTQTARFQGIPPTGRRVTVKVAGRSTVRHGQITEIELVLDSASVLYQLGMLPRMDPIPRPLRPLLGLRARMQKEG